MADVARLAHIIGHAIGVQPRTPATRLFLAFSGATLGILFTGTVLRLWLGSGSGLPLLIAPIGASAVLLFAVPASPMAQPWAVIGGNTISALVGVTCLKLLGNPDYAACLAVASAIAAMAMARCLHPPGGAVALTATIGGPAIAAAGWSFALFPVMADSLLLVGIGWLFHAAMKGNYPHRAARYVAETPPKSGYTLADVEAVLAQYDELLDVDSEDLDTLFRQVEGRAWRRLHGVIRCDQIMRADGPMLAPEAPLADAEPMFAQATLRAVPVVDADGVVEGLLGIDALRNHTGPTVGEVMDPSPCITAPATPIDELLPILSGGLYAEAVVADAHGRYLGLITQTDLLAALWRGHIAEHVVLGADSAGS